MWDDDYGLCFSCYDFKKLVAILGDEGGWLEGLCEDCKDYFSWWKDYFNKGIKNWTKKLKKEEKDGETFTGF